MYVYPVVTGTPSCRRCSAVRAAAARLLDGRRRRSARTATPGSTVDADRAAVTTRRAWRVAARRDPARFPRRVLRVAGRRDHRPVVDRRTRCATCSTDHGLRHVAWFTFWQAVVATGAHARGRPARPRTSWPATTSRPAAVPRVRDRAVRAADGGGRDRVPRAVPARAARSSFLGWQRGVGPLLVAEVFFNVAVVVRTVGGFWANLDPRRTDAARVLGASRVRAFREVTLPLLGPADRGGRVDRVPVHVHLVRRGAAARRSGARDARGRDLPPGGRAVRLPDRGRARARADRRGRARCCSCWRGCRSGGRSRSGWWRRATRRAGRAGRERVVVGGVLGATTVFLGGPLLVLALRVAARRRELVARVVPGARLERGDRHAVRPGVGGAAQLARVRGDRGGDRGGGRRAGVGRDRVAPGPGDARDGHVADAAARHVGGHDRLRVPRRARPLAGRPPGQGDARADRAGGGRDPVRDPRGGARAALDRSAPARRGAACSARRRGGCGARSTCRSRCARSWWRSGSRSRCRSASSARRCSSPGPTAPTIPIAISRFLARPGELNIGQAMAMSTILMVVTGAGRARDRARARAPARRVLMLRVEQARSCASATRPRSTASISRSATGETVAILGPSGCGQDHAAARDRRPAAARRRAGSPGTATISRRCRRTDAASG